MKNKLLFLLVMAPMCLNASFQKKDYGEKCLERLDEFSKTVDMQIQRCFDKSKFSNLSNLKQYEAMGEINHCINAFMYPGMFYIITGKKVNTQSRLYKLTGNGNPLCTTCYELAVNDLFKNEK